MWFSMGDTYAHQVVVIVYDSEFKPAATVISGYLLSACSSFVGVIV